MRSGRIVHGATLLALLAATACAERPSSANTRTAIAIEHVVRLGDADGPGMLSGLMVSVSKLTDGRYAVSDQGLPGIVRLFAPDGSYLSTIGRHGAGPGEFQIPIFHFLDASGDTLFIVDVGLGRISAFSADGTRLHDTRLSSIGAPLSATYIGSGAWLANGVRLTSDGVGVPLHLMSTDGTVLHSFGPDVPVHSTGSGVPLHARRSHSDETGTLWVASMAEYRIEKWRRSVAAGDGRFTLDTVFAPTTVPFPPLEERPGTPRSPRDPPPPPIVRDVWREPGGPVWVVLNVAHEDWRDRLRRGVPVDAEFYSRGNTMRKTVVEALDAETGEVLASLSVEDLWMAVTGHGEALSYWVSEVGIPYVDLWRPRLRESP